MQKKKSDSSFYIDNEKIDIVQNYTCLGTCVLPSGNLTLSLDHPRQKALHALFNWDNTLISKAWNLYLHAVVKSGVSLLSRI